VKKILALFILVVGGVLASLIAFSTSGGQKGGIFAETGSGDNSRFGFGGSNRPALSASQNNEANLTDSFTQKYLEEFIKSNPEGPQLAGDIPQVVIPSEETFQALLGNYLNSDFRWEKITEKDVKISAEADSAGYLSSARRILDRKTELLEGEVIALSDFLEKGDETPLRQATEKVHGQLREVLGLSPPPEHKELHLRLANFFQKQVSIYNAMLGVDSDPVRALLAINEFPATVEELENLRIAFQ
jgi:hypothetical protein